MENAAQRGYAYFLSSRSHGDQTRQAAEAYAATMAKYDRSYTPFDFGILLSVYVSETDEQAKIESRESIWYFLRNCLKGHLRTKGRTLTWGPGVPSTSPESWRGFLENWQFGADQLGDTRDWEDLDRRASIIVGSPETVREKLIALVELAQTGNLLIQFHFGNMSDELARKSMRLFAERVAPALRAESKDVFARDFPEMERMEPAQ
jgi:alkanesulfonate monooxygenase SsuD/methylene tetrahydromethanopterin reductase-like flavin-dependent oxidoreductase (luciferase family)